MPRSRACRRLVQRVARPPADRRFDAVERRLRVDAVARGTSGTSAPSARAASVQLEFRRRRVAVADAGDAHRVVVGEQLLAAARGGPLRSALGRSTRTSCSARSCAGCRSARRSSGPFDAAGLAVGHLEIRVDAAELQRQRVERRVRPGAEYDRVLRRGASSSARWGSAAPEAGDEHLRKPSIRPRRAPPARDRM